MTDTELAFQPFQKYVDFSGRARRKEFWYFQLIVIVIVAIIATANDIAASVFQLAILLPQLAVSFRRLHDTNRSGWWILLVLIPVIGWIILLIWYCTIGTDGDNDFGSDPLLE